MTRKKKTGDEFYMAIEALELSKAIMPMLQGRPPHIIGGALADLLSIWLAGHPREVMGALLTEHITAVKLLELESRRAIEAWAEKGAQEDQRPRQ